MGWVIGACYKTRLSLVYGAVRAAAATTQLNIRKFTCFSAAGRRLPRNIEPEGEAVSSDKVVRAVALGLVVAFGGVMVPFAIARTDGGAGTRAAAAPAVKLLPNLKRACGKSRSSVKLKSRVGKRVSATTIRYTYRYCSGRTLVRTTVTTPGRTVTKTVTATQTVSVPGPATTVAVPGPTTTVVTTAPTPPPVAKTFRLTLLHNNDGESKYATGDSIPNYGGVARFKTVVDRLRAEAAAFSNAAIAAGTEDKATLTISSGDNFLAGSGFTAGVRNNAQTGAAYYDSVAMNRIGYDAATLGNHEYDFGPNVLGTFIEGTDGTFPFLTANVEMSGEPALARLRASGRIASSAIIEKGGERVGVIGVSPPNLKGISSPGNVVVSQFTAGVVNNEVAKLKEQGIDKIILSSHLQDLNNEKALVPLLHDVDIVIGGGGDNLLANPADVLIPAGGVPAGARPTPEGPYPTPVNDADGVSVPVVTTSGEYDYVGRLTATFDAAGRITGIDAARSGPVRVSGAAADADLAAEDAVTKAQVTTPITTFKAALAANVIATTQDILEGGGAGQPVRNRETNLGDVVADGFRYAANQNAVADGRPIAEVAFSNGGGVRVTVPAGNFTEQNAFDVLPFSNFISTVPNVTPAKLKELMEWGVSAAFNGTTLVNDGKFPQISGFKMTVDRTQTAAVVTGNGPAATTTVPGQRVRTLTLDDGTPIIVNGAIAPGAPNVDLATTDFTAANGDNYPFNVPFVRSTTSYTDSLLRFLSNSDTVSGLSALNHQITSARYPLAGDRITFSG